MQATGRLDREHRIGSIQMLEDKPLQCLQAGTQHRQRQRFNGHPGRTGAQPDPVVDLARIDRDHQR
jgi:hypothetical protein